MSRVYQELTFLEYSLNPLKQWNLDRNETWLKRYIIERFTDFRSNEKVKLKEQV